MLKFLGFDFETDGFGKAGKGWKPGSGNVENYPNPVQLAWGIYNEDGEVIALKEYLFYPQDHNGTMFVIPASATKVHGITTEKALEFGVAVKPVLEELMLDLEQVDVVVAHNGLNFDSQMFIAYCINYKLAEHDFENKAFQLMHPDKFFDTMSARVVKDWVDARSVKNAKKAPNMGELYAKCFGKTFDNAHTASGDVTAMMECFFHMVKIGVISKPFVPVTK